MPEIDMSDEKAEAGLLDLLRGEDATNFSLTVTVDAGRWTVSVTDQDSGAMAVRDGDCFAEAWFRQQPGWARGGQD